jgi:uncharacterized membrane protein YbhN (UPF0104 family)
MNINWKAYRRVWLTLLVVAGIAIALATLVDLREVVHILSETEWIYLLPAIAALVCGYMMLSTLWRYLLLNRPRWFSTFHATNLSNLINILSPIPAFPVRLVAVSTDPAVSLPKAISSEMVVRLLDQAIRVTVVLVTIFLSTRVEIAPLSILVAFLLLVAALLLLFWMIRNKHKITGWGTAILRRVPRISDDLAHGIMVELMDGLTDAGRPDRLIPAWLMMAVTWICFYAFHFLCVLALDQVIPLADMLVIAMFSLAIAPPTAPAMPGVFHAAVTAGLSIVAGYDAELVVAYAVVLHATELAVLAVLGLWALIKVELTFEEILSSSDKVAAFEEEAGKEP